MRYYNLMHFLLLIFCFPIFAQAQQRNYLQYVQAHCDNLIAHGQDAYGEKATALLASVIDSRDMSIPKAGVPATEGTRDHDRAVGGSNFYHDVETIKVFETLSQLTGDSKYSDAAQAYAEDFLKNTQNPYTGLLGWGEHLYYNFYADSVMVGDLEEPRDDIYHEFLAETPPWPYLWEVDTSAVRKAIDGVRYHFRSTVTQSFLFNRHAHWDKVDGREYRGLAQYQDGGQPWIKHSGLQCYSFTFLYAKTGDPLWKRWVQGTADLYWRYRHPETQLTVSCIDDPRDNALHASLSSMSKLSYYLLKAWQLQPELEYLRERAEIMMQAAEKYSWDEQRKGFYNLLELDGSVFDDELIPVVYTGYGGADIITFGRYAAYFHEVTGDPVYRQMVEKVAAMLLDTDWPDDFVINSLATALQFSLDAYEVTGDERLLKAAQAYADTGIDKLWSGKLFVRQPGDPYYESKLRTNSLVAGLLRLHFIENDQQAYPHLGHWSL